MERVHFPADHRETFDKAQRELDRALALQAEQGSFEFRDALFNFVVTADRIAGWILDEDKRKAAVAWWRTRPLLQECRDYAGRSKHGPETSRSYSELVKTTAMGMFYVASGEPPPSDMSPIVTLIRSDGTQDAALVWCQAVLEEWRSYFAENDL